MDDRNFSRQVAASWISLIESDAAARRVDTLYPLLNSWLETADATELLDLGCGQGVCSQFLNLRGRRYYGIDASPALIDRARQLYADAGRQFTVANAYELPFATAGFDAAFSVSLWHLLADLGAATSEVFRVLSPGGHFLIVTANPDAYTNWTESYVDVVTDGQRFEGSIRATNGEVERDTIYLRPLSTILDHLDKVGFIVDQVEGFSPREEGEPGMYVAIAVRKA